MKGCDFMWRLVGIVDALVGSVRKSRLVGVPDSSEDKGRLEGIGWID